LEIIIPTKRYRGKKKEVNKPEKSLDPRVIKETEEKEKEKKKALNDDPNNNTPEPVKIYYTKI
jgi:hypothetical protein